MTGGNEHKLKGNFLKEKRLSPEQLGLWFLPLPSGFSACDVPSL